MASTSASSSVQRSFKYDVFLSFRGEDTRKTFVDHLYLALVNKGIITYKDDEKIEKGERISDQLIGSIEESRFYIIVFSKSYASSSWCLDELVKIMECQKTAEQTAYPVFYDVEPTEVRHQSGSVGEAFAKHVKGGWSSVPPLDCLCSVVASCCHGSSSSNFIVDLENEDDVGRWRNAMKEAAGLAGMELKNTFNGHEAKIIQRIVEEVSQKLHFFNSSIDGKLVGMETRVKDIVSSLKIDSDDVRMIGIKGMGGGGKTTLARAVFDYISIQFEGKSFVESVREVSKGFLSGLKELQKQLLSDVLNDHNVVVTNVSDGKHKMKKMMGSRKVLVVLDDVDDIDQLEALAGELNWFKSGSRIIITTRDEQILVAHGVHSDNIHDVNLLSDQEAICLFSRYAFKREIPNQGYEEVSRKIVNYAAGLPLTIKVLGSHLCGRSECEWFDAIERLKTIPLEKTLKRLELSYNGLENDEKEIFLDVVCILKGKPKNKAIRILESCGFKAQIGLRVLEQKSLITISNTNDCLGMHDHIEEMGMNIVRRSHEPNKHSRLWIKEEIEYILANDLGTEETKCIRLDYTRLDPTIIMKGLGKMKKLRLLHVWPNDHGVIFKSDELDEINQYLPDALQSLQWYKYPFHHFPKTFRASNLVNLEMVYSEISEPWEDGEGKGLSKLKFVDLRYSKLRNFDLTFSPHLEKLNLGGCPNLKLHMPGEYPNLKILNLNLGMTRLLEQLNLEGCSDFVRLQLPVKCPNLKILTLRVSKEGNLNLGMTPHLEKLDLHACKEFELDIPVECPKLKDLKLKGCKVSNLNLELTPNLEKLHLRNCDCLQKIHAPVGCLKKVVECLLDNCSSFVFFEYRKQHKSGDHDSVVTFYIDVKSIHKCPLHPKNDLPDFEFSCTYDERGSLRSGNLEKLISTTGLCVCKNLEYLSATICGLQHIRKLTLGASIPGDPWQFESSLKSLHVWMAEIKHLPDSICKMKHLKSLIIQSCQLLEQLPENICTLECLEELHIRSCPSLRGLPNNIFKLKRLKELRLTDCCQVEELPKELGRLERLEQLEIKGCKSLHDIPNSICKLKCLKELDLNDCCQVKKLPEELGCLEYLEKLYIRSCRSLQDLPNSICKMKQLKHLSLYSCGEVKKLPEELGFLEFLEKLELIWCTSLRDIPNSICKMKCLKVLNLEYCRQLEKLPEELGCLESLEELELYYCKSLREIPNSICNMKCLRKLNLKDCDKVEKLPEELGRLECLTDLRIEDTGIRRLPQSIFQLKGLWISGSKKQLESYGFPSSRIQYPKFYGTYHVVL